MKVIKPTTLSPTEGSITRATTAMFVDAADGLLKTAGVNVHRYQDGAVLIEPAATPLLFQSNDLRNPADGGTAYWSNFVDADTSVALVSTTLPTGATGNASKIQCATTGIIQRHAAQNFTAADNATVTLYLVVKAAEVTAVQVLLGTKDASPLFPGANLDVSAGTVINTITSGAASITSARLIRTVNGWRWFALTYNVRSGPTSPSMNILLRSANGLAHYSGAISDGVLVYCAQGVLGTEPGSIINTTGALTARAADVVTYTAPCLIASTADEPSGADPAIWNAGTSYTLGDKAYRATTHRVYRRLVAGTTATAPESDLINWADDAPTHRWAMFDNQVSTATAVASPLNVVLAPGYINALALLEIAGTTANVTVTDGPGGPIVYSRTLTLDGTLISDWYQYIWEPFAPLTEWVLSDIPPYANAVITVSITGGTPSVGVLAVGTVYELGDTKMGARLGIVDYSRKVTAEDGTTTFVRRKYSKRMDADLMLSNGQLNKVSRVLADVRATPCVWIGTDAAGYESLIVFGFYRDFSITVAYPSHSLCNLLIEGLV